MTPPLKVRRNERASVRQSDYVYAYMPEVSGLYLSTGHKIRGGRDMPNDPFFTRRVTEDPGFGAVQTFISDESAASYYGPSLVPGPHFWKPFLGRYLDITYLDGSRYDVPPDDPADPDWGTHSLELNALGTKYINRLRPLAPMAALGQFVGELHDLPRIPGLKARAQGFLKLGADEFLNVEFGWKPFIKDLQRVYAAQTSISERLSRLIDRNGLPYVRRSKVLVQEEVLSSDSGHYRSLGFGSLRSDLLVSGNNVADGFLFGGPCCWDIHASPVEVLVKRTKKKESRTWFKGTFVYYVPDPGTSQWTDRTVSALYDNDLSKPHIIWELYPWSWLVDWFTNVGDIISNYDAFSAGDEALFNAFVMREEIITDTIDADIIWDEYTRNGVSVPAGSSSVSWVLTEDSKMRKGATPFGFGIDPGSLTTEQGIILAALGISRVFT